MLSGVKLLSEDEVKRLEKERKHHKEKHKSKSKKHKKDRKERRSDDRDQHASFSDDSGSSQPPSPRHRHPDDQNPATLPVTETDQKEQAPKEPGPEREDWMTIPMGRSLVPKPKEEEKKQTDGEVGVHSRELNPFLRPDNPHLDGDDEKPHASVETATKASSGPGDGGASWRMKALRRAQAQATAEGKAVQDIVSERWGSMQELTTGMTDRRSAAHSRAHLHASRDRRREAGGKDGDLHQNGDRGGKGYLDDVRSQRSQMRRPSEQNLSWRRGGGSGRESGGSGLENNEATLRAVAPEMNAFANDGSFMDQFLGTAGNEDDKKGKKNKEEEIEEPMRQQAARIDRREEEQRAKIPQSPPRETARVSREERAEYRERNQRNDGDQAGNKSVAAMLRARLSGAAAPKPLEQQEEVALPLINHQGRAVPGAFGRESAGTTAAAHGPRGPPKRLQRYDEKGQRKRYYADDDQVDLDTLVKRTKYQGADDIDANMARNISRKSRFQESELNVDDEYDYDVGLDLADGSGKGPSKDARRRGTGAQEATQREKQRQIRDYNKYTSALDRCNRCFTSKSRPRHLTVAIGTAAYLAVPPAGRLVPGHCQIIPVEHVPSSRNADEVTWTEIRNFKKCLLQMYASQGVEVIFLETATRPSDMKSHTVIDCIPVPSDVLQKAPMYFKKAIDDATSEWSQHAAKRVIDIRGKKDGLRGAIPPNFPYFFVEFGLQAGFVHVIDDAQSFDTGLGRSVLVGLMGLPPEDAHRRGKRESEALQATWAHELKEQFAEFDWTRQL